MPAMRSQASAIYIGVITVVASLGPVLVSISEVCNPIVFTELYTFPL